MRTTRLTPRRLGMQSFRNAWQRLSVTLLVMVLTMAAQKAWADGGLTDYTFSTGVNQSKWITLSNNATQIVASGQEDGYSSLTNIGFTFQFGDGTYSQFWANSNGIFSFNNTPTGDYRRQFQKFSDMDCTTANQPKICGITKDLHTGSNGYVKYELTGSAPNRVLVCEYYLRESNQSGNATFKFQVQLYEFGNKVVFVYGETTSNPTIYQIGLSQSSSDIWTVNASTHQTAHATGPVSAENNNIWPGVYRYYEFAPFQPFTDNGDDTYTILNDEGWDAFCDMLDNFDHNTSGGYCFDGKTVKLDADISITRAAGNTGYHDFTGIFDGQGHTLSVDITDTQNQGTAPFRVISNATIRNLHVTGSVTGTTHAAGLVGKASAGTILIENCLVEANVNSTVGNNRHCGGIVGHGFGGNNPVNLTLRNCVYAGTITCDKNYIGGLQGWSDGNTLTLENCLFAGSYQGTEAGTAAFHPIALHNTGSATTLTATNVFAAVAPTATNANFIAADGIKTTGRATAPAGLGNQVATYNYMNTTVYQHGLLYNGLYYVAPTLSTDNNGSYLINNEDDWTNFCDALYNNGTWNRFSGQTVKLGADISVSRMAGYDNHDFLGTFDGNHKKLTFTATATASYLAPFRNVLGNSDTDRAVIQDLNVVTNITSADQRHAAGLIAEVWGYVDVTNCNVTVDITATKGSTNTDLYPAGIASQVVKDAQLAVNGCTVDGTIATDGKYAGGIIGIAQGSASITDCLSSVTIDSSTEGDGTHGGLVGVQGTYDGSTITIKGCVFNGQLLGASTHSCGGFVGWRSKTVNISNSFFVPVQVTINTTDGSTPCATFVRNGDSSTTITNCYYTQALGTVQGAQAYSITAGEHVTTLEISGTATNYTHSGLDFYSAGFKCGDVLYAAANNQVSLTLAHEDREGYDFIGYTPTAGTLNGSTLTMPNENVTINADYTYSAPSKLATTDITSTTATLSWSGEQDSYNVRYRTAEANEWQTIGNIAATTTTVTGLTPETPYEWQVQGITGGVTDWSETATFTTLTPTTTLFAANATNDWTTWCSPTEWTVDDSQATVYTVSSVADGTVTLATLSDATLIPAYMPLLIQRKPQVTDEVVATFAHDGDPSNLNAAPYSYTSVEYFESIGTVMAQTDDARFYGNTGTEGLTIADLPGFNADTYTLFALYNGAFLRVGSTTGGFPANRCLLAVKNSALSGTAASRLAISIGDSDLTGIEEITDPTPSPSPAWEGRAAWYTLDGRKLDGKPSHPGVYIYNGKKQVIKK